MRAAALALPGAGPAGSPTALSNEAAAFDYRGPPRLQLPLLRALRRVIDPELALSIVDLGLVHAVCIDDRTARVRMTMTSAACPVADLIVDDITAELEDLLPGDCAVEVEVCWEPAWTPDRMSASARRFMA